MKFLALKHHVQLHPGIVVSKNPQNIVAPLEGYRASLTCLVKSTHVFDWDLKKQVEIWRNKCPSIFFFVFLILPFPDIFLFYRFYHETGRVSLQVCFYLASVLFLLQVQRKHQQPNNQARCRICTQQYGSTTERLCFLLPFWLARLHTRAGMIPPFRQSGMNSEMIMLRSTKVKMQKIAKRKSGKIMNIFDIHLVL